MALNLINLVFFIGIILYVVIVLDNKGCLIDIVLFMGTGDKIGFIVVGLIFGNIFGLGGGGGRFGGKS